MDIELRLQLRFLLHSLPKIFFCLERLSLLEQSNQFFFNTQKVKKDKAQHAQFIIFRSNIYKIAFLKILKYPIIQNLN